MILSKLTSGVLAALTVTFGLLPMQSAEAQYGGRFGLGGLGGGSAQVESMKSQVASQIQRAASSGMSPTEVQAWQNQLTTVSMVEQQALADGYMSPQEANNIVSMLNRLMMVIGAGGQYAYGRSPWF
jgi:hypothetical protein